MPETPIAIIIAQTQKWLQTLVIDLQLCPFAQRVFAQQAVHYCINRDAQIEARLVALISECQRLDKDVNIATSLFICPDNLADFDGFLDFLALAQALLKEQAYEGIYQLASFHPDYCFNDASVADPSNFTNRSPYPMLQLLRESDIEHALQGYAQPEQIPQRNISLTRQLGNDKLRVLLSTCFQTNHD